MWFRLFFWLRLFTPTAFYVRLLTETMLDITSFMIIYILIVTAFANIIYVLNLRKIKLDLHNGLLENDDGLLYEEKVGHLGFDAWMSQWLLGLG